MKERIIIRDDVQEISQAVKRLISDGCNLILTSGGLGPTHDDMTLKGIAEGLDTILELNELGLQIITRQYSEIHQKGIIDSPLMTPARKKMAYLPKGSKALDNKVGGAPGVLLIRDKITLICLPGVPAELMWIYDNQVQPYLSSKIDGYFYEETTTLPLSDESILAPLIDDVMKQVPGVWVKSLVKPYGEKGIRVWISGRGLNKEEIESNVKKAKNMLLDLIDKKLLVK